MRIHQLILVLGFVLAPLSLALADTLQTTMGGDTYAAGEELNAPLNAPRDVFWVGATIKAEGTADGDAHYTGFSIDVAGETGGDLYLAGMYIDIRSAIGSDVSAAGFDVHLTDTSSVQGNARLMGSTVTIDAPVAGALSAAGEHVILNSVVSGDAWITAERISFGPDAQIEGELSYSSPEDITVSETVITRDRIRSLPWGDRNYFDDFQRTFPGPEYPMLDNAYSVFAAFMISLGFLLIIGAIFLVFAARPVAAMRREILERPGHIFLLGIIGLSMLFGIIPVTGLTILGLPFVPIGILLVVVMWTLGYLLGAYAMAMAIFKAFGGRDDPTLVLRLFVLALGISIVALLNYIPFAGWVVNYTLVLIGTGAITSAFLLRLIGPLSNPVEPEILTAKDD